MRRGFSLIEVTIALAIITVLMATVGFALSEILDASDYSRNLNTANFESQRAITEVIRTLRASSRRDGSQYRPRNYNGELAFRMVCDFDVTEERAVYTNFFICYYRDAASNTLRRRFRKVQAGDPGDIIYQGNVDAQTWDKIVTMFGEPAQSSSIACHQVIANNISNFSFEIEKIGEVLTIKVEVTSTVGTGRSQATVMKAEDTTPFNWD